MITVIGDREITQDMGVMNKPSGRATATLCTAAILVAVALPTFLAETLLLVQDVSLCILAFLFQVCILFVIWLQEVIVDLIEGNIVFPVKVLIRG